MKNIAPLRCLAASILLVCCFSAPAPAQRTARLRTVVIDAGHGGKDPGCLGKTTREKHIALAVALAVGKLIKQQMPAVKVLYTRSTDRFVELHERADFANKNRADLFISIHCNANPNKQIHGTETYAMGLTKATENLDVAKRENSVILQEQDYRANYDGFDPQSPVAHIMLANYQNAFMESSLQLAERIEHQFRQRVGRTARGVKQAGFIVLWQTAMPSVLIEIGFLSNPAEEKYLKKPANQELIASGIFRAFRDYKESLEGTD